MSKGNYNDAMQKQGKPPPIIDAKMQGAATSTVPLAQFLKGPRSAQEICAECGSAFIPPDPLDKISVALETLDQLPLNALRLSPERGLCGWYVWGGKQASHAPGAFKAIPVANLLRQCPQLMPFLALAPGWKVLLAPEKIELKPPQGFSSVINASPPAEPNYPPVLSGQPSVTQFVLLSVLLHILAILLLGDTTGNVIHSGYKTHGIFSAALQARLAEPGANLKLDHGTLSVPGPVSPRSMVAPKPRIANPISAPAVVPRAENTPPPLPESLVIETVATSTDKPPVAETSPLPLLPVPRAQIAVAETPPIIVKEAAKPDLPRPAPPPASAPVSPPITASVLPKLTIPAASSEPVATLRAEKIFSPPPPPLPRLEPLAPPSITLAPAKIEWESLTPPAPISRLPKLASPPTLHPMVPTKIVQESLSPAPQPAPLPRLQPLAPPPALTSMEQVKIKEEMVPPPSTLPPLPPPAPLQPASPTLPSPPPTPAIAAPPAPPVVAPAAAREPAAESSVESAIFKPRREAAMPSAEPGATPRLDLDAMRQRARDIAGEGSTGRRTLLPLPIKPKQQHKSKEELAFDKALKRPDCRDAYADMGLAAVIPLVRDSISGTGCKW